MTIALCYRRGLRGSPHSATGCLQAFIEPALLSWEVEVEVSNPDGNLLEEVETIHDSQVPTKASAHSWHSVILETAPAPGSKSSRVQRVHYFVVLFNHNCLSY